MQPKTIDKYFVLLNQELGLRADIILTGASAGALMGHIRPSVDIDFEIRPDKTGSKMPFDEIARRIQIAARKAGVAVQYHQDISRWSMISFLNYRRTARTYKNFGKLRVKIIAPEYWTIGKMARYLRPDENDMIKIIRQKKIPAIRLVRLWSRALLQSDLSLNSSEFRTHVLGFLKTKGKEVWGRSFDSSRYENLFKKYISK